MNANVLATKTQITAINQDDLDQLALKNRRATGFDKERLAGILAHDIAKASFGTQQLQVKEIMNKVELKRKRRESGSVFQKTAADAMLQSQLITNALPITARKASLGPASTDS